MAHARGGLDLPEGVTDITPGVPGHDLQVVDRTNILIDDKTGRMVKVVPIGAKMRRTGRRRRGGSNTGAIRRLESQIQSLQQQSQMNLIMGMAFGRH